MDAHGYWLPYKTGHLKKSVDFQIEYLPRELWDRHGRHNSKVKQTNCTLLHARAHLKIIDMFFISLIVFQFFKCKAGFNLDNV